MKKKISAKDLDQAVKASYNLGIIDAKNSKSPRMRDLRRLLKNMLSTNVNLWEMYEEEDKDKGRNLSITPAFARGLLRILKQFKNPSPEANRYFWLKRKYEFATGEKFVGEGNKGRRGEV